MPLDANGARRFYDRLGRLQDTQRFYEDPAVRRLVELGNFEDAASVFELGCGTGRLAASLLDSVLPSGVRYVAVDVSPVMVQLASRRLRPYGDRVAAELLDAPALRVPGDDATFDRFVATYVFDLLPPEHARALIEEAARLLTPGGLITLTSLTRGTTTASRVVAAAWRSIALRWPALVGGCRPIELEDLVTGPSWRIQHEEVLVRLGVPSEVVIAERVEPTPH